MKFIKLKTIIGGNEVYVNPNQVCIMKPIGGGVRITFSDKKEIEFIETADEIMEKIKNE